jgi:Tfp pilus assembly protein PilF
LSKYVKVKSIIYTLAIFACCVIIAFTFNCTPSTKKKNTTTTASEYLNHNDTVKYVGMAKCAECHADIAASFKETGMGKSFDEATPKKSAGDYSKAHVLYDKYLDFNYTAQFTANKRLLITEFRLNGKDTSYTNRQLVDYVVGSGQHTNSHLNNTNGYVCQMPMTFYTQKQQWDMPPGFENGANSRFERKIGLECMSCHNSYPTFVKGSENKYENIPNGISCERCHGPGQLHVEKFARGEVTDTAHYIDYSIVNPAKLKVDKQFDLCSRCHLQGNAVLAKDKSFFDFKPGMRLADVMTVFLPKYKNADDEFIMASHADRLKQSKCFTQSMKNVNDKDLRPYKNGLTCVTCHNPHVSVKKTGTQIFNNACIKCHTNAKHDLSNEYIVKNKTQSTNMLNCVACHMPQSGSIDIPHVSVHDHYIRVPVTKQKTNAVKTFVGLKAINDANPSALTTARAYIAQYEKFENNPMYLDSALHYLQTNTVEQIKTNIDAIVNVYFLKLDYATLLNYVAKITDAYVLNNHCTKSSYDNQHAWTAYRIATSCLNSNNTSQALIYYNKACALAPYMLDFKLKYATTLASNNFINEAQQQFEFILKENPKHIAALANYGFLMVTQRNIIKANEYYNRALALDPDYETALMNKAGLLLYQQNTIEAKKLLTHCIKKHPSNTKAKELLRAM